VIEPLITDLESFDEFVIKVGLNVHSLSI